MSGGSARSAVAAIEQVEPDLLLLDIQLQDMDGFEVLRAVGPSRMPHVIFVTAYDQFALRAFEVHALDYLLKPFGDKRFFDAIARAKDAIRRTGADEVRKRVIALLETIVLQDGSGPGPGDYTGGPTAAAGTFATRIAVKETGRVLLVKADEIDWIEAADYCAKLHVRDRVHVIRESLKALAARLDPARFFRVSRSAIVNLDRVREIQPFSRGSQIVILKDGTQVVLSRSRREALEHVLQQSL